MTHEMRGEQAALLSHNRISYLVRVREEFTTSFLRLFSPPLVTTINTINTAVVCCTINIDIIVAGRLSLASCVPGTWYLV